MTPSTHFFCSSRVRGLLTTPLRREIDLIQEPLRDEAERLDPSEMPELCRVFAADDDVVVEKWKD